MGGALGDGRAGGGGLWRAGCGAWSSGRFAWPRRCVLAGYIYRKIGGATGDTFGAVCEIVEVVPALALALEPEGG